MTAVGGLVTIHYSGAQKDQTSPETVAQVDKPPASASKKQTVPAKHEGDDVESIKPAVQSPLREGKYELQEINGVPQKGGIIMQLSKVTDDYFLADNTTPTPYSWKGKLMRKNDGWDLVIVNYTGPKIPRVGSAFNPGSGFNRVVRQGPLVTFQGGNGTFVWRIVE
jgi:hypothetical protein